MSKIARVFHLNKEIQKIYKNGVLQKLFFDWKKYIGEEINIEHAKECAGRNVVINGKTYQNLVSNLDELVGKVYTLKNNTKVIANLLKINTTYTFVISLSEANYSDTNFGAIIVVNYPTLSPSYINISRKNGIFKIKYTVKEEIPKSISISPHANNDTSSSFKLENLIILEGDYTHIDLPNSINGIESVGKREFVKSKNLFNLSDWYDSCEFYNVNEKEIVYLVSANASSSNYISKSNLLKKGVYRISLQGEGEEALYSRIEVYTVIDDVSTKIADTNVNSNLSNSLKFTLDEDTIIKFKLFVIDIDNELVRKGFKLKNIQLELGDVSTEYEPFYEYYPVTIKNYNYKCETDNIILPNGVKNNIDTIDGKKVHVQRVWKRVVDGSDDENWGTSSITPQEETIIFQSTIIAETVKPNSYLISNKFNKISGWNDTETITMGGTVNVRLYIGINRNKLDTEDLKGFKKWLSENPVTVWYELATPIYTYLESGLYDNITLPTSNIKNEIYLENGKWYHKRNIGKVVFDGSDDENWSYNNDSQRFFIKAPNDAVSYQIRTTVYLEGYHFPKIINENKAVFLSASGSLNNTLYIYNYDYTTVDDFKAYLAENPLEVYYELAEPVITELYYNNITYKLDEPLRSLPDGVCDTIEEGKIVKRVEKVIVKSFDNLNVILQEANNNRIGIKFGNENNSSVRQPIISDNFFDLSSATSNTSGGAFLGGGRLYLTLGLSTIEEYNNWFKNNPTTFYYQLNPPIETEITPDMILINGETITDTIGTELPNEVKDSIEEGYYIKRVGKVTYNGQEDWKTAQASTNVLVFYLNNTNFKELSSLICDTYTVSATSKDKTITCGNAWRPQIRDDSCSTVEEFKQLLAKNPITVWYELATPVKIPLFSIKEGLNTLKSTNNITPQLELDCLVRDDFQNLCDNIWESGDINLGGVNYDNINRIRLVNYIELKPNTIYRLDITNSVPILNSGIIGTRFYDSSKKYLGNDLAGNIKSPTYTFTTPADCYYIRFIAETRDTNFKIYLKEVIN